MATGSDTGGSIRVPAAYCGVTGLKPTYGLFSRYGLVAFASSLDQIGPLARTVEDAAMLLGAIAGHDPLDSTSFRTAIPDYRAELARRPGPWKLGVPREYFGEGLVAEVGAAVRAAIDFYCAHGCEIRDVSLPLAADTPAKPAPQSVQACRRPVPAHLRSRSPAARAALRRRSEAL